MSVESDPRNMWFPSDELYQGCDGLYLELVENFENHEIVELVQERVKVEGAWLIKNNLVGGKIEKMQLMMAWVGSAKNIEQCVDGIWASAKADERTVDSVCRELAKASQEIFASM